MKLKQKLYDLKNKKQEQVDTLKSFIEKGDLVSDEYKAAQAELERLKGLIAATEALIEEDGEGDGDDPTQKGFRGVVGGPGEETSYQKAVKEFADAARNGFPVSKAAGDFMQGGVDADGGYAVPEDIVTKIIHLREAEESLLDEVTVIPVKNKSGRRTYKKRSQHEGFQTVAEAAKYGKTKTPQYATMKYDIEKRGGVLPITNELLEDSDANIVNEAEQWLAGEARATGNFEVRNVIAEKEAVDLGDVDGIIAAYLKLGSAFRKNSKLITNTDGLIYFGQLEDMNGRKLLNPNPANPNELCLCVGPYKLPIKDYDNTTLPSDGTKIPMVIGNLKEGIVYWDRRSFSIKVSDAAVVGDLNAFEQDLTLLKGSMRDDCTMRDDEAFVNGYINSETITGADDGAEG